MGEPDGLLSMGSHRVGHDWSDLAAAAAGLCVHHQLLEFTQTHVHRVSDAIQPSHPLSSPSSPAPIPPSIRVFSIESTLRMRWPKYWSFSFSIIPSKEHPGFISFRMDWLDLLAVQGTLKSLLQHHSSKASILQRSAFFTVQLSHPYMTTGKFSTLVILIAETMFYCGIRVKSNLPPEKASLTQVTEWFLLVYTYTHIIWAHVSTPTDLFPGKRRQFALINTVSCFRHFYWILRLRFESSTGFRVRFWHWWTVRSAEDSRLLDFSSSSFIQRSVCQLDFEPFTNSN